MPFAFLAVLLPSFGARTARADIVVTNIESGATLRYPVAFLQGNLTAQENTLTARISTADAASGVPAAVAGTAFKVFVELAPGKNSVVLDTGKSQTRLDLTYQPETSSKSCMLSTSRLPTAPRTT